MNCIILNLSYIKDLVLIISSLTTVFIAIYSIRKWRKEFRVKVNYDLSRSLLKTIYATRDKFKGVRSELIMINEYIPNYKHGTTKTSENYHYVFKNRLIYFNESYSDFLSLLPEAEVVFGKKIRKECQEIIGMVQSYLFSLNEYLQIVDSTNNYENLKEVNSIVFSHHSDDKFGDNFEIIIKKIEQSLIKNIKI